MYFSSLNAGTTTETSMTVLLAEPLVDGCGDFSEALM
jgi:hypothetical protein